LTNCTLTNNITVVLNSHGGAIRNDSSTIKVINCTIAANRKLTTDTGGGGGIYFSGSIPVDSMIANSIIWANKAGLGTITLNDQVYPNDSISISYSCINGISFTNGNKSSPPEFNCGTITYTTAITVNRLYLDMLNLSILGTVCRNAGNDALYPTGISRKDVKSEYRFNEQIDMGAYETWGNEPHLPCIFDDVEFETDSCGLISPAINGWQDINVGCNSVSTKFLVEDASQQTCGGINNETQWGHCKFTISLQEEHQVEFLVKGNVEEQNPGWDHGVIKINGAEIVSVESVQNKGDSQCTMELRQDTMVFTLEPGEYEIAFSVDTEDPNWHKNCFFEFSMIFDDMGGEPYTTMNPEDIICPQPLMGMSLFASPPHSR
jgi:hypothetical protein